MSAHIDYNQLPEVIKFCCNCTKISCNQGKCKELMNMICELKGEEIPKRFRPRVKPIPPSWDDRKIAEYTINGEAHTLKQWCEIYGIKYHTVYARIRCGRTLEQALTDPLDESKRPRKRKAKNKA